MSEQETIDASRSPVTVERLTDDLGALGLRAGDTVVVHSSLSELGWVSGGPTAVVDALLDAVTPQGTLVMPTHTGDYSDPEAWENPPVPESWHSVVRESMPAYRPTVTPTRGMGAIPECFRSYPDVVRSRHPQVSFAARGSEAATVTQNHRYAFGLAENSPLARLYDLDASVLLLGVGYDSNTSLHLAEHRADLDRAVVSTGAPVLVDGTRTWVEFEDIELRTDDFVALGRAFEESADVAVGPVGYGTARLMSVVELVEFGVSWFERNRSE